MLELPTFEVLKAFTLGFLLASAFIGSALFVVGQMWGEEKGLRKGIQVLRECTEQIFVWGQLPENSDHH